MWGRLPITACLRGDAAAIALKPGADRNPLAAVTKCVRSWFGESDAAILDSFGVRLPRFRAVGAGKHLAPTDNSCDGVPSPTPEDVTECPMR